MTQIYESVLLMHPTLADDGVETYQEQFTKIITDAGGEIVHTQKWGKRRLQYPIARQKEAFYILICFKMSAKEGGAVVAEFERQVRINDELLREMTIKVKVAKLMDPPTAGITFGRGGPRVGRGAPPSGRPSFDRDRPSEVKKPAEPKAEGETPATETPEAPAPEAPATEAAPEAPATEAASEAPAPETAPEAPAAEEVPAAPEAPAAEEPKAPEGE